MRHSKFRRLRAAAASTAALAVAVGIGLPQASADSSRPRALDGWSAETDAAVRGDGVSAAARPGFKPSAVAEGRRAAVLGEDFADSGDRALTTSGDATGFHVMVAEEKKGYGWRTAATLSEAGFETDAWIGNACVTESGRYAAVAYAPRTFTNKPELMSRGAFTAIVDLDTGSVRKLPFQASLGYFSPGCGSGENAVFSQFTDEVSSAAPETRLITVAGPSGTTRAARLDGQITSAVPVGGQIVAAHGNRIVGIDGTRTRVVARTHGVPFQLKPDAGGGVTFIDRLPGRTRSAPQADTESEAAVFRVTPAQLRSPAAKHTAQRLVRGKLTSFDLARAADGTVFVTGTARTEQGTELPGSVRNPGGIAKDARLSSHGRAALTTAWADGEDSRTPSRGTLAARPARVTLKALDTGESVTLDAMPHERIGTAKAQDSSRATSPVLPQPLGAEAKSSRTAAGSPVDADRTCSVPRGDLRKQAFQPTPRQVEWAVDQTVVRNLNAHASRPAGWKGMGMPAYSPQTLFPLRSLTGGTGADWHIPAQIMLGITAQESNMWQATRYAVPGVTANPLIGNYYGVRYSADGTQHDPWAIDWSKSDCGYGIAQVTDGMRLPDKGEVTLTPVQQEAVALDYAANIAKGADILADKWNQTRADGLVVNNGEPKWIENWFYALWAYNSGYYPKAAAHKYSGKWGVGWTNNPANPLWKENRNPFLESDGGGDQYADAATPQNWPYQEKVIGWAARPLSAMFAPGDFRPGYRQATWLTPGFRTTAKPPIDLFCDSGNDCAPSKIGEDATNHTGGGPCLLPGDDDTDPLYLKCWYHQPVSWKDCGPAVRACGYPLHRFDTGYAEQPDGSAYPPRCSAGLPAGSLVVDDIPAGTTPSGSANRDCGPSESAGTFTFDFASPSGRIDLHQIGAGYDNHFWFSHTHQQRGTEPPRVKVTGTWALRGDHRGWMRVWVHLPDHGAHTRQALYSVMGTDSTSPHRSKPQRVMTNKWVSLGAFNFTDAPRVSLSNVTRDGNGTEDVAWDAVAFQPLGGKPRDQIVAMGDSYSSGEGVTEGAGGADYYPETDFYSGDKATMNGCHRSRKAWSRQAVLPARTSSIGTLADAGDPSLDFQFVACSGARHYNLIGEGQHHEPGQIAQGALDQHTSLVTVSIGGNDARFADVVTKCVLPAIPHCSSASIGALDPDTGEKIPGEETGPLEAWAPVWMHDTVRPRLVTTLKKIQERAPNARIVLMGYPRLLTGATCANINEQNKTWLNGLADLLAAEMAGAVADANSRHGTRAVFSDPRDEFDGKAICGSPEGVHGIILSGHSQADLGVTSSKSFHPNIYGAALYTDSLEATLSALE